MLEFLTELFTSFFNFFISGFKMIMSFIVHFYSVVKILGDFLSSVPSYFYWLPDNIVSIIVVTFGLIVVYKILGREG